MIAPIVDQEALKADIPIEVINIEARPDITMQYRVSGVPTVLIIDEDGAEVMRKVGAQPPQAYAQAFQEALASLRP